MRRVLFSLGILFFGLSVLSLIADILLGVSKLSASSATYLVYMRMLAPVALVAFAIGALGQKGRFLIAGYLFTALCLLFFGFYSWKGSYVAEDGMLVEPFAAIPLGLLAGLVALICFTIGAIRVWRA